MKNTIEEITVSPPYYTDSLYCLYVWVFYDDVLKKSDNTYYTSLIK